jgi:glucose/arabinose dehydrogenase
MALPRTLYRLPGLVEKGDSMSKIITIIGAVALLAGVAAPGSAETFEAGSGIRLEPVATGFNSPLYLTAPADDDRLFVVEQPGRIRVIRDGQLLAAPFLNLASQVSSGGERGLLSVAFHPRYASNGFFYVNYTDRSGNTRIERYSVSSNPDVADPTTAKLLLTIQQPFANHNGGLNLFGPDGMLYIGMGDGGSSGDPMGNGQNRNTLLGKLLRIDVDGGDPYAIPPDNPFVGQTGARGEIWALGLRNPWRFSFDRETNLLYVADVGQDRQEEIDIVSAKDGGLNYGWNLMEGPECYRTSNCDQTGLLLPALSYTHSEGCSVTGGYVYRGSRLPSVVGHYFFADYCSGWIRSFKYDQGMVSERRQWSVGSVGRVLSFGEDAAGELYVCSANGTVYRIEPA